MREFDETGMGRLTLPEALRLEGVCDRFESAWRAGQRPRIEDYLRKATGPGRAALLRELLTLEVGYRARAGESPAAEDYHPRFPRNSELIAAVFGEPIPRAGRLWVVDTLEMSESS